MHEYWSITCDKCIILMEDINRGSCEVYGDSILSLQFFCKSKTVPKMKFIINLKTALQALCQALG